MPGTASVRKSRHDRRGAPRVAAVPVVLAALASGPALGQETAPHVGAEPSFGEAALEGGFTPDPHLAVVEAGGPDSALSWNAGCSGYLNFARPDYRLRYTPGDYVLTIAVEGSVDTTLAVNGPNGDWHCNDDAAEEGGWAPGIEFEDPQAGAYDIWVGTFDAGEAGTEVELAITESGYPWLPNSTGTGFFVGASGHLLTNHHVVEGCSSIAVRPPGEAQAEAVVVAANADADLALLKAGHVPAAPAVFRAGPPLRQGERGVVYGFPLYPDLSPQGSVTDGLVSALSGYGDDLAGIQVSAATADGSSGSPVLDESGHVVAVVDSNLGDDSGIAFAVRGAIATAFLDVNDVDYEVGVSGARRAIPDIVDAARGFAATVLCHE